ncbi:hypothetical protein ACHAQE_002303 [Botrytis cinerea]
MLALSFVVILVWDTHFPWWAFIVCVAIPVIWTVPVGIIFATTNIQIGLNVFTEFVIGYMLPGRPVALMLFKAYESALTPKKIPTHVQAPQCTSPPV